MNIQHELKRIIAPLNKHTFVQRLRGTYYGEENIDLVNIEIAEFILNRESPFIVGRTGRNEIELCGKKYPLSMAQEVKIQQEAGFYYKYIDAYKSIDICGCWTRSEKKHIAPNTRVTTLTSLEPFFSKAPWTDALDGLNVVVISPFVNSIEMQYNKGIELNFNKMVSLPRMDIRYVKAFQTNANLQSRSVSWFENLNGMLENVRSLSGKRRIDVCLIGCGAYGLPLAYKLKSFGISSIVLGGVTQLIFSVYGARHMSDPYLKMLIDDNWVRPSGSEQPESYELVEGGAYW
jgi:hypothetical protein